MVAISAPVRPVHALALVVFDLDVGQVVEAVYPDGAISIEECQDLAFHAFPDTLSRLALLQGTVRDSSFFFRIRRRGVARRGAHQAAADRAAAAARGAAPAHRGQEVEPPLRTSFLHCHSFCRQRQDDRLRRGAEQRAVVAVSLWPLGDLLSGVAAVAGPEVLASGPGVLSATVARMQRWRQLAWGRPEALWLGARRLDVCPPEAAALPVDAWEEAAGGATAAVEAAVGLAADHPYVDPHGPPGEIGPGAEGDSWHGGGWGEDGDGSESDGATGGRSGSSYSSSTSSDSEEPRGGRYPPPEPTLTRDGQAGGGESPVYHGSGGPGDAAARPDRLGQGAGGSRLNSFTERALASRLSSFGQGGTVSRADTLGRSGSLKGSDWGTDAQLVRALDSLARPSSGLARSSASTRLSPHRSFSRQASAWPGTSTPSLESRGSAPPFGLPSAAALRAPRTHADSTSEEYFGGPPKGGTAGIWAAGRREALGPPHRGSGVAGGRSSLPSRSTKEGSLPGSNDPFGPLRSDASGPIPRLSSGGSGQFPQIASDSSSHTSGRTTASVALQRFDPYLLAPDLDPDVGLPPCLLPRVAGQSLLTPGPFTDADLYGALQGCLPSLWSAWEMIVLGEPLLVVGASPAYVSAAVSALVSLTTPLPYAHDYRPYLTIQDPSFGPMAAASAAAANGAAAPSPPGRPSAAGDDGRRMADRAAGFASPPLPSPPGLPPGAPRVIGMTNLYALRALPSWRDVLAVGFDEELRVGASQQRRRLEAGDADGWDEGPSRDAGGVARPGSASPRPGSAAREGLGRQGGPVERAPAQPPSQTRRLAIAALRGLSSGADSALRKLRLREGSGATAALLGGEPRDGAWLRGPSATRADGAVLRAAGAGHGGPAGGGGLGAQPRASLALRGGGAVERGDAAARGALVRRSFQELTRALLFPLLPYISPSAPPRGRGAGAGPAIGARSPDADPGPRAPWLQAPALEGGGLRPPPLPVLDEASILSNLASKSGTIPEPLLRAFRNRAALVEFYTKFLRSEACRHWVRVRRAQAEAWQDAAWGVAPS